MGKIHHHRLHQDSGEPSGGEDSDGVENKNFHKGPWTSAEDKLLIAYVQKHGDGNWNSVQKNSGLSRCGKSCRLRWVNHLRPDLKKGAFTSREEQRVIELHASMGNKWARMAAELPGRTDNEIKNFWNTRLKRLQRHGLPIYPDDVRAQVMNLAAQSRFSNSNDSLDSQESLEPVNSFLELPQVEFDLKQLKRNQSNYESMLHSANMYSNPTVASLPSSSLFVPSGKRPREPETTAFGCGYATNEQLWNHSSFLDGELFNATATTSPPPPPGFLFETPAGAMMELPSFQCFDPPGDWGTQQHSTSPMPMPHESDNTLVVQTPPDFSSSFYDGLLESVVYGSSRATNTETEDTLFQPSSLLTPPDRHISHFETGLSQVGSSSSYERDTPFDGDWIRHLLGEDRDDTK